MRIHEFLNNEEWGQLQKLIYTSVWEALNTYQKQRYVQQRPTKLAATLKPKAAKTARTLAARKAKHSSYVAAPKPLPKPQKQAVPQASASPAYNPVKAPTPLPASTKTVANRNQPKPIPQSTKIPPSMQPLPSGLVAMINAKTDPVAQKIADKERG